MTASRQKIIVNGQITEPIGVQTKVEQDVSFLQARLEVMKKHPNPNRIVIEAYESILKSRMAVLSWLRDGNRDEQQLHNNLRS